VKRDKLLQIVSNTLDVPIEDLERMSNQDLESWDSLGHIKIIVNLERELNQEDKFLNIDISDCTNFEKLEKRLVEHGYVN
jgi:acyl carrier protein